MDAQEEGIRWQSMFQGRTVYQAICDRDELLIVQGDDLHGTDIVPRKHVELTEEDKSKLERIGLPSDTWQDDGAIMKARLDKDTRFTVVGVERSMPGEPLSKKRLLRKVQDMMKSTTKFGIGLRYHGPGKQSTGDWCFDDGFITFSELAGLYMDHFRGKILSIVSDCSYSGSWTKSCIEMFEEHGVKPCGHSAREKGILIEVIASCRSTEVPYQLYYALRVSGNDKNTGMLWHWTDGWEAAEDQHVKKVHVLVIECESKSIDDPCTLGEEVTWRRLINSERIFLVRGTDQGRPAWHYALLVDDEETVRKFKDQTQGENAGKNTINISDYGQVLKSGWGKDPPNDVKDWMQKTYGAS